jgi:hypothetical protein
MKKISLRPKKDAPKVRVADAFSLFHKEYRKDVRLDISKTIILSTKKQRLLAVIGIIAVVSIIAITSIFILNTLHSTITSTDKTVRDKNTGKDLKAPDYPTLLPEGKTIESLGGWTRVSPPDRNPVFAYVDTINNKQINVSQQPLPTELKEDTGSQVEQLATGYKATEKVTVGDITVFIGTSAKGPQSAIFAKNNVLVLIKTSVPISDDEWASYVTTLR